MSGYTPYDYAALDGLYIPAAGVEGPAGSWEPTVSISGNTYTVTSYGSPQNLGASVQDTWIGYGTDILGYTLHVFSPDHTHTVVTYTATEADGFPLPAVGGVVLGFSSNGILVQQLDGFTVVPVAPNGYTTDPHDSTVQYVLFAPGLNLSQYTPDGSAFHTPDPLDTTFTFAAPCFAAGTLIGTPEGDVPVERLGQGDAVLTHDGRVSRVVWAGSRTVDCARHPNPAAVRPVSVAAGAFGPSCPRRTLFLSPDHAVFADGVLIPIKYLINDGTVRQHAVATVTYHHIELEQHDVVRAEGLPCESFLDTGNKGQFAGRAVTSLRADFSVREREAAGCAPLVVAGPAVDAVRALLSREAVHNGAFEHPRAA